MKRRFQMTGLMLLCAVLLAAPVCVMAQTVQLSASAGYDGRILGGRWYPVEAEITAGDAPVDGVLSLDVSRDYGTYDRMELPVHVEAGETARFRMTVMPQIPQQVFNLTLAAQDGEILAACSAFAESTMPEEALVVGVAGGEEALVQALNDSSWVRADEAHAPVCAIVLTAENFMQTQREMDAFDALVLAQDVDMSDTQRALVARWQEKGGVLIRDTAIELESPFGHAQRILRQIGARMDSDSVSLRDSGNFHYRYSLAQALRAQGEGHMLPAAFVLAAYVLLAGAGLYLLLKRLDRSRELWLALPAAALVCTGLVVLIGVSSGANTPVSASLHVTHVDREGRQRVEEMALLSYASQERMTVTASYDAPVERLSNGYYSSWYTVDEALTLRDVVTLGDTPSIELAGQAAWYTRSLVIGNNAAPQGEVRFSVHMEADGLHAEIENDTDALLSDAVLLTPLGYAWLDTLEPGAKRTVLLKRQEDPERRSDGGYAIRAGQLLPFESSLYTVAGACAYPEKQDGAFSEGDLPDAERYARMLSSERLLTAASAAGDTFPCVIVAQTPQIACAQLCLDGVPVKRTAQESLFVQEADYAPVSQDGHFYYPQGVIKAHETIPGAAGAPRISETGSTSCRTISGEAVFGYDLSCVEGAQMLDVRIVFEYGDDAWMTLEAYDHATGGWFALAGGTHIRFPQERLQDALGEENVLFLRCIMNDGSERYIYAPAITVEGSAAMEDAQGGNAEGSEDA